MGRIKMLAALVRWSFALTLLMLGGVGNVVLSTQADAAQERLADVRYSGGGVLRGTYDEVTLRIDYLFSDWSWGAVADHGGETFTLTDGPTFAAASASLTNGIDEFVELTSGMGPNTQFQDHVESELFSNSSLVAAPNGIDYAGFTITGLRLHVDRLNIDHVCVEVPFFSCDSSYDIAYTLNIFVTRPVPEPNTYAMILAGLVLIGAISAKARR